MSHKQLILQLMNRLKFAFLCLSLIFLPEAIIAQAKLENDAIRTRIEQKEGLVAEYDRLYEVLTAPVEYHFVTLPYGQETISFRARIKISSDNINANYKKFRSWTGLKITFEAIEPQRQV